MLDGRIEVHTEFYDPVVLEQGESIYIDSQMGHAYVVAEGCERGDACSASARAPTRDLMSSLLNLHGSEPAADAEKPKVASVRDLRLSSADHSTPPGAPRRRRAAT